MKACYNVQTCTGKSDLEDDIRICAEVGFEAIEVSFAKVEAFEKKHNRSELGQLLKKYNIKCGAVNAIFNTSFCIGENWNRIQKQLDLACDICQITGSDCIIVLPDEITEENRMLSDKKIFDVSVKSLRKMADYVKDKGVRIAFEPVGDMLVGDIENAWKIVQKADRENVGLTVDAFNLFLWDLLADMECIGRIAADKLFMVHINDAESIPFRKIDQMHRCMPGDGRIDVEHYIKCVKKTGYTGYVSVEVLNPYIWKKGAKIVIPEAYQKLQHFISE